MWWNRQTGLAQSCAHHRTHRLSAEPHGETAISRDMDLPNTGPIGLETGREPTPPSLMCGRFSSPLHLFHKRRSHRCSREHRRLITHTGRKPIGHRSPMRLSAVPAYAEAVPSSKIFGSKS